MSEQPPTAESDAGRLCPKCLGLGGWPCDTDMPHYADATTVTSPGGLNA